MEMKRRRGSDDGVEEFEFPSMPTKQCQVTKKTMVKNMFTIYLDEDIREPSYYRDACEALTSASEEDLVRIIINTNGGQLDSANIIRQSIMECEGHVVGELHGMAASAGSMIALACPFIEVKPHATMMIHQASFGVWGSSSTIYDHVDFSKKTLNKLIKEIYEDFLSPEEIQSVLTGKEFWFDSEEIGNRLEAMYNKQKEKLEKANEALKEQLAQEEMVPVVKRPRKKRGSVVE